MNPRQGLLKPLWFQPARHLWKLMTDRDYRISAWLHSRYGGYPRHTPFHCKADGLDLSVPDAASFLSTWDEIFARQLYRCELPRAPRILDLGANIGLASLYFLRHHPDAAITALEPDLDIFDHLRRNLAANHAGGVNLLQAAAWTEDTELGFAADRADGGHVAAAGEQRVRAIDTRRLLAEQTFDLVKMDIEGAERTVLPALAGLLDRTRLVFVEYHGDEKQPQQLDDVIGTLSQAGFRLHIESLTRRAHPWLPASGDGLDLQLNIFGWRP
jgi:FkbM family methyltransferase